MVCKTLLSSISADFFRKNGRKIKLPCFCAAFLVFFTMVLCPIAFSSADVVPSEQHVANELFSPYGLEIKRLCLQEEYLLPDTLSYSATQEESFYWAYVNELLAVDGVGLTNHLGNKILATMYETDKLSTKAVVISADGSMIGAYRIKKDSLLTLDGRTFEEATQRSMLSWLSENGIVFADRYLEDTQDARKTAELYFDTSVAKDWIILPQLYSEEYMLKRMPSFDEMQHITQPPGYIFAKNRTLVEVISVEEEFKNTQPPNEKYFRFFAEFDNDMGDGYLRPMIVMLRQTENGWRVDNVVTGL